MTNGNSVPWLWWVFPGVGEIEDHRVVEHRALALGHAFEAGDDAVDEFHVVELGALADFLGGDVLDGLAVADVVHVHLLAFDAGDAGVVVAEFVHGESDHVGQAGDQRGKQHLGVADLAGEGVHVVERYLLSNFGTCLRTISAIRSILRLRSRISSMDSA